MENERNSRNMDTNFQKLEPSEQLEVGPDFWDLDIVGRESTTQEQ